MLDPISTDIVVAAIVSSAHALLPVINNAVISPALNALIGKGAVKLVDKVGEAGRKWLGVDEKDQKRYEEELKRHLVLALRKAVERGMANFHTRKEQELYSDVLMVLSESGASSETLRREAMMYLFTLETPDLAKLNTLYNNALRARSQEQVMEDVDAAPYLSSFFEASRSELYNDPLFHNRLSDALQDQAATATIEMPRSLAEVVATLSQIYLKLADNYTTERFKQDMKAYTAYIDRRLRSLQLVGVIPEEGANRNPELDNIYVDLRISLFINGLPQYPPDTIVNVLKHTHCLVLLGKPGSGKSTAIRYLAWSHAVANMTDSTSLSEDSLLPGSPLPLRIELRQLAEERRQHSKYGFLKYASKVLLKDLDISQEMFKILLDRGMMLILFDGLDEVATLDDRRRLVEDIEDFAQRYPGNRFLVTSRPVGYEQVPLNEQIFSRAQIEPFGDEQIGQFLEKWYKYVLKLSPLSPEDEQKLAVLKSTLLNRLLSLAENPLLLTVITNLHRHKDLPDRRARVYDECAELLLERWAKLKGTIARWRDLELHPVQQYACVAHLGFVLHERAQETRQQATQKDDTDDTIDITDFSFPNDFSFSFIDSKAVDVSEDFMQGEIEKFLLGEDLFSSKNDRLKQAKLFFRCIQEEAGLIVESGKDENNKALFSFVHPTFQEYFAAADIHERYQHESNLEEISKFLCKRLYDPHWSEVILLLFGKIHRGPANKLLRDILEGKIKAFRSKYDDLIQQNLFFASSCLGEGIFVENDLVKLIVSRLGDLVKSSPFPSQSANALEVLGTLMQSQTRQYMLLAQQELRRLVERNEVSDISAQINAAVTLFQYSTPTSEEQKVAAQSLLELAQRTDLPLDLLISAVQNLHWFNLERPEALDLAARLLRQLVQRSDLSIEQRISAIQNLYTFSLEDSELNQFATQSLLNLAQQQDLLIEQRIQAFRKIYEFNVEGSKARNLATRLLRQLIKQPDFPIEQRISVAEMLYFCGIEGSQERNLASQLLLNQAKQGDLLLEQFIQTISNIRSAIWESKTPQFCNRLLQQMARRADLQPAQRLRVVQNLYQYSSEGSRAQQFASQSIRELIQSSDLPDELRLEAASNLYSSLYWNFSEESELLQKLAFQVLLSLAHEPVSSIDSLIKTVQNLYLYNVEWSQHFFAQLLQRSDLSIEQQILVARNLFLCSPEDAEEQLQATQLLWQLVQRTDLDLKQQILGAENLYLSTPEGSEMKNFAIQLFGSLAQRADLPVESFIESILNIDGSPITPAQSFATRLLLQIAHSSNLSTEQRIQAVIALLTVTYAYSERIEASQIALDLLQGKAATDFFEEHWTSALYQADVSEIPLLARFVREYALPTRIRDEIYQTLRQMVPQFDQLK